MVVKLPFDPRDVSNTSPPVRIRLSTRIDPPVTERAPLIVIGCSIETSAFIPEPLVAMTVKSCKKLAPAFPTAGRVTAPAPNAPVVDVSITRLLTNDDALRLPEKLTAPGATAVLFAVSIVRSLAAMIVFPAKVTVPPSVWTFPPTEIDWPVVLKSDRGFVPPIGPA